MPQDPRHASARNDRALGELLVEKGRLSASELASCVEEQRARGGAGRVSLRAILVERGLLDAEPRDTVAAGAGPTVDVTPRPIPPGRPSGGSSRRFSSPLPLSPDGSSRRRWAAGLPNVTPSPTAPPTQSDIDRALEDPDRRVGRYVLVSELGRGGMGVVYRGWDPELRRDVAIKMILDPMRAGEKGRRRFEREAQAVARLRHPGIVAVHETGESHGKPYIVMDFIEGPTLEDARKSKGLPPRRAAEVIHELAAALAYAHDAGVLHRDLKPQNVLVDREGKPHIVDFGLASTVDEDGGLTATGQLLGTPQYVSPEQARGGDEVEIGPTSDIYSLGAVLYWALTGRPPFDGSSILEIIRKVFQEDPVPPRDLVPSAHPDLETIALKCLEKEPGARYQRASDLAADLRRFLDGEAISARNAGRAERLRRWTRRNRAKAAALATAAVALAVTLVGGAAFAVFAFRRIRLERDAARDARTRAEADRETAVRREEEARRYFALALIEKATRVEEKDPEVARILFARALELHDAEDARNRLLGALLAQEHLLWARRWERATAQSIAVSPDGRLVATGGSHHDVKLWRAEDGELVHEVKVGGYSVMQVAFSPEGGRLAAVSSESVDVVGVASGRVVTRYKQSMDDDDGLRAARWVRGGSVLAVAHKSGRIRLLDPEREAVLEDRPSPFTNLEPGKTLLAMILPEARGVVLAIQGGAVAVARGGATHRFVANEINVLDARLDRDGERLVTGGADGVACVWDVATGDQLGTLTLPPAATRRVGAVAWDPEGGRVAVGAHDGGIWVWDFAAGLGNRVHLGPMPLAQGLTFTPDGRGIAFAACRLGGFGRAQVGVLDLDRPSVRTRLPSRPDVLAGVSVSGDGRRIALGDGRGWVEVWDVAERRLVWRRRLHEARVIRTVFSPDGRRLLSASTAREIEVVDVESGAAMRTIRSPEQNVQDIAVHPDGTRLATVGYDAAVRIWDLRTGEPIESFGSGGSQSLAWSPDGETFTFAVLGGQVRLRVGSSEDGLPTSSRSVRRLRWFADGRRLLTVSDVGRIQIWDTKTRRELARHDGHVDEISSRLTDVEPCPDGALVASSDSEGILRLWRAADGSTVAAAPGQPGEYRSLAWAPDGTWLATVGDQAIIWIWDRAAMERVAALPPAEIHAEQAGRGGLVIDGIEVRSIIGTPRRTDPEEIGPLPAEAPGDGRR